MKSMQFNNISFRDAVHLFSAGSSLKSMAKATGVDDQVCKGIFPFDYLDSYDKLHEETLPREAKLWFSKIKGESPTQEEIDEALAEFSAAGCVTNFDRLAHYLLKDCQILFRAMIKHLASFQELLGCHPLSKFLS